MKDDDLEMLVKKLKKIKEMGWIESQRPGNQGGVGNTLEDLLDVPENNLKLPDFGKWEIKTQRRAGGALLTLFHKEPNPRNAKIVPKILLLKYGWAHQEAGIRYSQDERSFRQTINAAIYSNRGFKVEVNDKENVIFVKFNYNKIDDCHSAWRLNVGEMAGYGDISPNPYWTFSDVEKVLKTKLNNLMYVKVESKRENNKEYFKYINFSAYIEPSLFKFIKLLKEGLIWIDFDARTNHNHGTKFRIKSSQLENLYEYEISI